MTLRAWGVILAVATVAGALLNLTVLHDPELAGALLLSGIIAALILGATHERTTT